MNGKHIPNQNGLQNKLIDTKKRQREPSEESFKPGCKKFKKNEKKLDVTDVDIVEQLKLKLKSILIYTNLFKTRIDDIQPYGSRVSGIYTDDSDVDFHISYTSKLPIKKVILAFAKSLRNSHVFINIVPIHHAKIPIIKCTHRSTGIDCDLSFNNMSAVYNSRLLNCIIRLDSRIKPVLMKLKGWAKHIGLICTNGFSSYSFYWLGIFCMQVIGILPSVNDLQKSIPQLIVGPWNCAFSVENQELINSKQTSLSEDDILDVIYSYYSNFDYETLVISPYVGCPVLKKNFENKEQLPEELWRYKQFYNENQEHPKSLFLGTSKFSMYLQDPFQHNLNITARVTPKIFEKFIKSCIELKSKPTS